MSPTPKISFIPFLLYILKKKKQNKSLFVEMRTILKESWKMYWLKRDLQNK